MNRPIKFRAWDVFYKKFVYGEYSDVANNMDEFWAIVKGGENSGREVPLMQFTGLTDKNGKDVFEGDFVAIGDKGTIFEVGWETMPAAFGLLNTTVNISKTHVASAGVPVRGYQWSWRKDDTVGVMWEDGSRDESEVIGNIYENPDLLTAL